MQGFRDFVLRGNLVEIAVALVMALSFAAVVAAFTDVLMGFIGKVGGEPNFDSITLADVNIGVFFTALVSFLILAAVVYFFVVVPYQKAKERFFPAEASGPTDTELLIQIRDLLASKQP